MGVHLVYQLEFLTYNMLQTLMEVHFQHVITFAWMDILEQLHKALEDPQHVLNVLLARHLQRGLHHAQRAMKALMLQQVQLRVLIVRQTRLHQSRTQHHALPVSIAHLDILKQVVVL